MTWKYRCMLCRGRNVFIRPLDDYLRKKKCRHCGHDRFYLDRRRQWRTDYCSCDGYHYTHRIGSTYCMHNPNYEVNIRVGRYGEDLQEVLLEIALREKPPETEDECPF